VAGEATYKDCPKLSALLREAHSDAINNFKNNNVFEFITFCVPFFRDTQKKRIKICIIDKI
jgi:hypothetical protein